MDSDTPSDALRKAVEEFGSLAGFCARLGVKYQKVQFWFKNRVPAEYCPRIERLVERRVRCEELRPDIDWAYLRQPHQPDQR
jgi:DNA-binding transcriptional regulator YdaS (Cro superfamily)